MCGIAGLIDWQAATSNDALRSIGEAMIETVRHRGPDAGAVWVEAEGGVALGQRRLAIIDLTPGGAQPMHSADAPLRHHLQRRDLQLPRHPPRARSSGPLAAQRFRYRGAARSLRAVGGGSGDRAGDRHVRVRVVGPQDADPGAGARPARHQAALLRGNAGAGAVRVPAQGVSRGARLEADHRRRCGRRLSPTCLCRAAAHDLSRSAQAGARSHSHPARGPRCRAEMLLGSARHCGRRPAAQRPGA